jgi:hypothetical protein
MAHFLFFVLVLFLGGCKRLCVCALSLFMIDVGYPLASAMCSILVHSICFCCGLRGRRCIQLIRSETLPSYALVGD